jgi:mono/diheme cytochrome c family protein
VKAEKCLIAAAATAVLLAGCAPGDGGGYERVVRRSDPVVPRHEHPDPAPVAPGTHVGPAAAGPMVAADLPPGVTQQMVEEGQQLYGGICSACHGANGVGSPVGPALNDGEWLNVDGSFEQIVAVIQQGVATPRRYPGMMPPRGGGPFDDEQVRSIAAYVYVLNQQGGT